jgi:hypothetical protein
MPNSVRGFTCPVNLDKVNFKSQELFEAAQPLHRIVVDVNYPDRSATTILAGGSGE